MVPADCLFLRSFAKDPSTATPTICYVQTAQLDGETNLKLRQMKSEVVNRFESEAACARFSGCALAAKPSQKFSDLNCVLQFEGDEWKQSAGAGEQVSLKEKDQLLLRGVVLKNVAYVYALVLYTGEQTKVRVAQSEVQTKRASVEAVINRNILMLVGMLMVLCLIGTVGYAAWTSEHEDEHHYLALPDVDALEVIGKLFTFFLLNAAFIPVSLYVSMKMARSVRGELSRARSTLVSQGAACRPLTARLGCFPLVQGQKWFMEQDVNMYYEDENVLELTDGAEGTFPMRVRTMDLNDELGQVSHVFSDKTGTFTLNYMELRKISVGSYSYGLGTTQIGLAGLRRKGAPQEIITRRQAENRRAEAQVSAVARGVGPALVAMRLRLVT